MEEHGTHCTLKSCNSISLLPIACPSCTEKYCEEHYLPTRHACANAPLNAAPAAGAIGKERLQCQVKGCLKPTLEMAASAIASSSQASGKAAVTHQAPRCARCKGLFCTRHRPLTAHACTAAPAQTEGGAKIAAAEERKRKAREILTKNFPNRKA